MTAKPKAPAPATSVQHSASMALPERVTCSSCAEFTPGREPNSLGKEVVHSVAGFHCNQNPEEPARWFYDDASAPWNGRRYAENLLDLIRANVAALGVEP